MSHWSKSTVEEITGVAWYILATQVTNSAVKYFAVFMGTVCQLGAIYYAIKPPQPKLRKKN